MISFHYLFNNTCTCLLLIIFSKVNNKKPNYTKSIKIEFEYIDVKKIQICEFDNLFLLIK